ncbi:MAG: alpha/beta hydrolase [Planctomycetia bacterium]|nr:alpha/beta hydrolase [Planctomycetia bacterium]
MERVSLIAVSALALVVACASRADETAQVARRDTEWLQKLQRSREALEWSDLVVRHDWRLQRRASDGRCRILDPGESTVREGTAEECRAALARLESEGTVPPVDGPTILVLHGLGEGRSSMRPLAEHLRRSLDATVLLFGYASTNADIEAHGRSLDAVITALPAAGRISFVGHSLGNLVVRRWMTLADRDDLARVDRMVMLGPPNKGSELARHVAGVGFLASLAKGAARDLVVDWHTVVPHLAVPPCEFGIVAGGRGDSSGFSPLLEGDDDAVVSVEETRLDGADDFLLLPVHHAAMLRDRKVQQATESFLKSGRFAPAAPLAPAARIGE